jgi:predicted signal transduction protein with EAL and GGDEF domain
VLLELLDLGVTIELDDFGTGYSSLTVLHHFPGRPLPAADIAAMLATPSALI